jgi:pyruvate dehydrogenase E2 component (dihydrolipoamide acetyltransferase)
MADVIMPQLGETITEGTITRWFKSVGDTVTEGEALFEVSTDKVDSEVPSPVSGVLTEIQAHEGDTVEVGATLAVVGDSASTSAAAPAPASAPAPAPLADQASAANPGTPPEASFFAPPAPKAPAPPPLAPLPPPVPPPPAPSPPPPPPPPLPTEAEPPSPVALTPPEPEAQPAVGTEIAMPQLGETITEGTITRWFKSVGDTVAEGDVLFEVSTDKVDSEVPSPSAGVLSEIRASEGETVEVGAVIAVLGGLVDGRPTSAPADVVPAAETPPSASEPAASEPEVTPVADPPAEAADATPSGPPPGAPLSPVVRRLVSQSGLDATTIAGSGLGGRITRADVEVAIKAQGLSLGGPQPAPSPQPVAAPAPTPGGEPTVATPAPPPAPDQQASPSPAPSGADTVVPMNNVRRLTGEHMVMSKATSPHVLTAVEVDFEGVEKVRRAHKQEWRDAEGFSLTYLPFIARAVVDAIHEYPHINASVGDRELIIHSGVNLGIAVDLDFNGLLAPVIQAADAKLLRALARETYDLASRARSKKLNPAEVTGGTFTITNPGQYGTLMQFPIINQPQVAILSTDGIRRKPVAITDAFGNESVVVHSVGILALAWDHRAFDGAYVAAFMDHLRTIIETRDWETELS